MGQRAVKQHSLHEKFTSSQKPARLKDMFKEALANIVESTPGGLAGLLMDFEGIPLETYSRPETALDIEMVGAEVSVVVKAIQRASEMLEAGETQEVAFKSDRMVTIIRVVNETYFLALALEPDGNFGKGRFLLRVTAPQLKTELEA
jgi:predicted regulator of Ras-like GTPase activity (Roadblock/LC7/MglB family)